MKIQSTTTQPKYLAPHDKVIVEAEKELLSVENEMEDAWFLCFRFSKLNEFENRLKKVQSKIENMNNHLEYTSESFKKEIAERNKVSLRNISYATKQLAWLMTTKSWFRSIVENVPFYVRGMRLVIGILKGLAWALALVGIPTSWIKKYLIEPLEEHLLPKGK